VCSYLSTMDIIERVVSCIRERVVDFRDESIKYPREEEKPQERPAPATTRSVYSQNSSKTQEGAS
jgi:hypothetical protein